MNKKMCEGRSEEAERLEKEESETARDKDRQ